MSPEEARALATEWGDRGRERVCRPFRQLAS